MSTNNGDRPTQVTGGIVGSVSGDAAPILYGSLDAANSAPRLGAWIVILWLLALALVAYFGFEYARGIAGRS